MNKSDVMRLGKKYPLQLTFSCIAPRGDMHCGQCNKCAERMAAFESVGMPDSTKYFVRGPSSQRTPRR
jgi:7-cyano-7-deazaguanine synthase